MPQEMTLTVETNAGEITLKDVEGKRLIASKQV